VKKIGIASVLSVLFLIAVFAYANRQQDTTAKQLCHAIVVLVTANEHRIGKPGTPFYAYYQRHPDELADARAGGLAALRSLPCKP
jgi:hypothetical protein